MAHPLLRTAALVFFFGYAAALVVAGAEGAVLARVAFPDDADADVLNHYRFLRALELCFGVAALVFWRRIFSERTPNLLFLTAMAAGVAARLFSLTVDGSPGPFVLAVLAFELVGLALIVVATREAR